MESITPHIRYSVSQHNGLLVVMTPSFPTPLTLMNLCANQCHKLPPHPITLTRKTCSKIHDFHKKVSYWKTNCLKNRNKKHGMRTCYRCGDTSHKINECSFDENPKRIDNIHFRNEK